MSMSTRRIPANILAAAKRAGLSAPDWYVGPLNDPDKPRKKTLDDLAAEAREKERQAPSRGRSAP